MPVRRNAVSSANTVLVTGAGGGIGSAVVAELRDAAYRVVGLDLVEAPAGVGVEWIRHDLLDIAATEALLAAEPVLAGLRHVVTVAGGPLEVELGKLDPSNVPVDVFRASLELNLVAQYAVVRAAAARVELEAPEGDRSILLFSSTNALRGYGMPGYSSAKAGLLGLVVALALPLGRRGVRINAITPGSVLTNRFREAYPAGEPLGARLVEASATGRATRAEDVARAVRAVLELRQMTGQHLVIDGGQMVVPFDRYPLD